VARTSCGPYHRHLRSPKCQSTRPGPPTRGR
jgi:hypothetical protein